VHFVVLLYELCAYITTVQNYNNHKSVHKTVPSPEETNRLIHAALFV